MDPSKRINKNPHVTPACHGCIFEEQDNPVERPCICCTRKEFFIDSELSQRDLMAHYKEYFENEKRTFRDYYTKKGMKYNPEGQEEWLRLGS